MKLLAPIVLFVYNRPEETRATIEALCKNSLAKYSDLYIYSDGPKFECDEPQVAKVREIITQVSGFKSIEVTMSDFNNGLAKSVINGVSYILKRHGSVIVLEDDLICSTDFLEFMNKGLEVYSEREDIWSVSGYSAPMPIPKDYSDDIYLAVRGTSWGWATWQSQWRKVDWDIVDFDLFKRDKRRIKLFNRGGDDLFRMLELQKLGKIDSWAIRWVYSQFKHSAYSVYPVRSKVRNEGIKKGGTHGNCPDSRWMVEISENSVTFERDIKPNASVQEAFRGYQNLDWIGKFGYFAKKNDFYNLIKFAKKYLRK